MYILDSKKLMAGDILLISGDTKYVSAAIKKATDSVYSHAALYLGDFSYIHSTGKGVYSVNIQRELVKEETDIYVVRIDDKKIAEAACLSARAQTGAKYSKVEAIKSQISKGNQAKNRQFCSRLVAQSYEKAGLKLVENSDFCSPADILNSGYVNEVEGCLREATKEDILISMTIDTSNKTIEVTNRLLKKIRDLTKKDINTFDQMDRFILDCHQDDNNIIFTNRQFDEGYTRIMKDSGFFELEKKDFLDYMDYDIEKCINRLKEDDVDKNKFIQDKINIWKNLHKIAEKNFETFNSYKIPSKLKYVVLMSNFYFKQVETYKKKIQFYKKILNNN